MAAAGLYYDRGELFTYLSQPAGSSIGGPFGVTESSPLVSLANGNSDSGLTLENPMGDLAFSPAPAGSYVPPSSNPGVITQALQAQLNQMTGAPASGYYAQYGKNCSGLQAQEGYFLCTTPLNFGIYDKRQRAAVHNQLHPERAMAAGQHPCNLRRIYRQRAAVIR